MFNWLIQNKKDFIIIANKADKVAKTKVNEYIDVISSSLKLREYGLESQIPIIPFSSINKSGKEDILQIIENNLKI